MPLLALASLFGYVFTLFYFLRNHIEVILFSALSGMVTLLYLAGLAGFLKPMAVFLFYSGWALFFIFGLLLYKQRKIHDISPLVAPGPVLFVLLSVAYWALFRDARYFFWDEFSHWGLVTREMLSIDALHDNSGPVWFVHYPPGAALWHYFVCVNTGYSEGATFWAQFTMLLAPLTILFRKATFRQWYWIPAILAVICLALLNLGHGVTCLYVDHLLGTWFAGVLLGWMCASYRPAETLLFVPPLFLLPLVKEVGSFLGMAASVWILLYALLFNDLGRNLFKAPRRQAFSSLILLLVAIFSPLPAHFSWAWRLEELGVERFQASEGRLARFGEALQGRGSPKENLVQERFWELVFSQQISKDEVSGNYNEFSYGIRGEYTDRYRLSAFGWLLLCLVLLSVSYFLNKDKSVRWKIIFNGIFLIFIFSIYTFMLLYLYLFIIQSERIPSYMRYYHVVVMPAFLLSISFFLPLWCAKPRRHLLSHGILATVLILLFVFETPYLPPLYRKNPHHQIRQMLEGPINEIHRIVGPHEKMYVIFQVKGNGYQRTMIHHDLVPVASKLSPHDIHLKSPGELADILAPYDYLWCLTMNKELIARHARLFVGKPWKRLRLFRIEKTPSGISLEPLA